ncbi:MAG: ribosome biogenesis factor YjgA [Pseudomonadota bacterium]
MQNDLKDDPEQDIAPSKTRRKQEMHALQDIGEQLVELNSKQLAELDLPEALMDAIIEARRLRKHEARRRQMQFIGKLMREVDTAPIREKFAAWGGVTLQHTAWLHLLERWRGRLLADEQAFAELGRDYPAADLQRLRTLTRNAHKEKLANKPPKSFRAMFHELQTIIPGASGRMDAATE